ncbi:MAG: hypothetical protein L6R48_22430, partial [Planctomycetes bacterium]|nr:hypothetical protein [Planctomycetota bacterium]
LQPGSSSKRLELPGWSPMAESQGGRMADSRTWSVDAHVDGVSCTPIWNHGGVTAASTWASTLQKSRPLQSISLSLTPLGWSPAVSGARLPYSYSCSSRDS